nr:DUF4129 domain-containing protein [Gemmatimonadales bacterium]
MPRQAPAPGELQRALDSVFATPPYRWAEQPAPLQLLREWWDRLGDWLTGLRADNPLAFRLLVLGLLVALLLVFAHAAYIVWRTAQAAGRAEERGVRREPREHRDAGWYSRAADRAAAEGRLLEALQLAFVSLSLTLAEQGVLDYHASKTPAEYAREARLAEADRARLGSLVRLLYAHGFGGRPLGPEEYRRWRDAGAPPWHAAPG